MTISGIDTGRERSVTGMKKKRMKKLEPYRPHIPVTVNGVTGTRGEYKTKTLFSLHTIPPPSFFTLHFSPSPPFPTPSSFSSPIFISIPYPLRIEVKLSPYLCLNNPDHLHFSAPPSVPNPRRRPLSLCFNSPASPPLQTAISKLLLPPSFLFPVTPQTETTDASPTHLRQFPFRSVSFSDPSKPEMSSSSRTRKQLNKEDGNSSNQPKKQGFKRTKSKSVKRTQEAVNLERLMQCEFVQTRWAHKDTLERLGLLEDVTAIMTNIGIERMLDMDYLVYREEAAHLIASFELDFNKSIPPKPIEELGCIRFRVKGRNYELSLKDLCEAYGFRTTYIGEKPVNHNSDLCVWHEIGYGDWKGSKGKAATIRNPSIRYVHKLLTQTIFARHKADKVKEDELALLAIGIKPFIAESLRGPIFEELNVGLLLARQIK